MAIIGIAVKSKKQQRLDAALGLIIDEMSRAMWNANRDYIARSTSLVALTPHMRAALDEFQAFCADNYGH